MIGFILRRLISVLVTFFAVSIIVFMMMHAIPGGPFDGGDMPVPDAVREKLNAQYGLDRPLYVQYVRYMWGVFHLDFGVPFQSPGETVLELLGRAWVPSLVLGGLGMLVGVPLGMLLGMAAALRRNGWIDYLASAVATLGLTVPVFVTSMLLILLFSVWLNWLPSSGWKTGFCRSSPMRPFPGRPMRAICARRCSIRWASLSSPYCAPRD